MLLGLDCGSTSVKAVLFDEAGRTIATGGRRTEALHPGPGFVEKDMEGLWRAGAAAIRDALAKSGTAPERVDAIGVTAHGDGLYLVDRAGRPLGCGIQSVDSRALAITGEWAASGQLAAVERLSAQRPYPYSATTLLAWIKRHQPERYDHIGHVMFCKDWLRTCLTGVVATDPTDASTAFTDPQTQAYDPAILSILDLAAVRPALPPILPSSGSMGRVTAEAAALTGLVAGTPVTGGMHDVTVSCVGLGNLDPGALSITAGTFSINETLSDRLVVDARCAARAGLKPGQWNNMSISPASSNTVDWFLQTAFRAEWEADAGGGPALWAQIEADLAAPTAADAPLFHPFLYGSPYNAPASASFFGLRSWHGRADMLRAVIEGAVFNHRFHVDVLRSIFPVDRASITGGGSSAPRTAQLFADALGLPVEIPEATEIGALGAALVAGVGAGLYASLDDAVARACRIAARYVPDPDRQAALSRRYDRYLGLVEAVRPFWSATETTSMRPAK
ncbi:FGGY-family carbohydrate kinase [Lichenifustis flavocetrariae]|uniref:Carbohydrate kinase n=1 Tax=Lichenifustis flavocetrariae TaxID=2949735 RepID=A0AA41YYI0_9HYPH|nr:FGGY-family carbohydrate kinase [Lichenifustis flavocetrariae]MCW6510449.1 carbohydrate kinase [Lichenifustis flavocetrariae]